MLTNYQFPLQASRQKHDAPRRAILWASLADCQAQFAEFLTMLHLHVPRALHGLLIDVDPALGVFHGFPLLVQLVLTPDVEIMYILLLGLFVEFPPHLGVVVMHGFWIDKIVHLYPGCYALEGIGRPGLFKYEGWRRGLRGREERRKEREDKEEE